MSRSVPWTFVWVLAIAVAVCGCARSLPTYPTMSDADALRVIAARLDTVKSISASTDLTLTDASGRSVSMDGAFVASPPGQARLRAWKLGTPVLDITILPDGIWAFAVARNGAPVTDMAGLPATGVSQSVELLSGAFFARAHAAEDASTRTELVAVGSGFGSSDVRCEIDRATLTPRRFVIGTGGTKVELSLAQYELVGDVPWARRMEFLAPTGTIVIRLADIELNGELPASAFVPPKRATRLP